MSRQPPDRNPQGSRPEKQRPDSSSRKPPHTKKLLATHQRSWIWGRHLVQETLQAARWPILELYLAEDLLNEEQYFLSRLSAPVSPLPVSRKRLTQLCGVQEHQGWLARVGPYPYSSLPDLFATQPSNPFWLLIEGIQDPYNLGTILRSAEVFAVSAVCLGTAGQSGINSLAARSSVGAVNRLRIAQVESLPQLIRQLQSQNITVLGTSLHTQVSLDSVDCTKGIALVIGNEGHGLSQTVADACSKLVKIPQPGTLNSLNAAAAAAIACYEIQRQRHSTPKN